MPTLSDMWSQLRQPGRGAPYVLIDCAGVEGGAARLPREVFTEFECLFTGDLAEELEDVAPYLGRLDSLDARSQEVVEDLLARHLGIVVTLRPDPGGEGHPSFSQVHRHFRKFNVVYGPDGKPLFFRYYDPRVIVDVLTTLDEKQLASFFGPTEFMWLASAEGSPVQCALVSGKLVVRS